MTLFLLMMDTPTSARVSKKKGETRKAFSNTNQASITPRTPAITLPSHTPYPSHRGVVRLTRHEPQDRYSARVQAPRAQH